MLRSVISASRLFRRRVILSARRFEATPPSKPPTLGQRARDVKFAAQAPKDAEQSFMIGKPFLFCFFAGGCCTLCYLYRHELAAHEAMKIPLEFVSKIRGQIISFFFTAPSAPVLPSWKDYAKHFGQPMLERQHPLTFVISFEDVVVKAEYSLVTGHKFALRPGIKDFLHHLVANGEVIIVMQASSAYEITECLMKDQMCNFVLDGNYFSFDNGKMCMDLSCLGRDDKDIVIISPDLNIVPEKFVRNTVVIRKYEPEDETDRSLLALEPILLELSGGNVDGSISDIRDTLDNLLPGKDRSLETLMDHYSLRQQRIQAESFEKKRNGIRSGILGTKLGSRMSKLTNDPSTASLAVSGNLRVTSRSITSKDIAQQAVSEGGNEESSRVIEEYQRSKKDESKGGLWKMLSGIEESKDKLLKEKEGAIQQQFSDKMSKQQQQQE